MIKIKNDYIIVSKDDTSYFPLKANLEFNFSGTRQVYKNGRMMSYPYYNTDYLYIEKDDSLYIQRGLLDLLQDYIKNSEVVFTENKDISGVFNINDFINNDYSTILTGITLRDYQLLALKKMLLLQRCIIQSPTGSGKTEIISAFIKCLESKLEYLPATLVIEPTVSLVNSTVDRFKKYGINAYSYRDNRNIEENSVIVCHPQSICNDLNKNEDLLKEIRVMIADETHHLKSITWRKPNGFMPNLQYSIGVSATAIDQSHVNNTSIRQYTPEELYIIGSTGSLAMNMTPGTLIDKDSLATPVLFRMCNPANEYIESNLLGSWQEKVSKRLLSDRRNDIICNCAEFFSSIGRKVLILVNTIKWSKMLLESMYEYNELHNEVKASYGGGKFESYNGHDFIDEDSDTMSRFANGEFNVLIGTTHLYEGIDVPNLDVIILAYGGKKDRLQLQGIGRALRKTKSGKYAYIVDFTDHEDNVLRRQSETRFKRYKDDLRIPDDRIYNNLYIGQLDEIFNKLEK